MKKFKKLLAAAIIITTPFMFIDKIPEKLLVVSAIETMQTDDGFQYIITDKGEITITGYIGTNLELNIPSKIDKKPVTSIGDSAFLYCSSLTNITIPDSVTSIGDFVFWFCSSLTSVTIPDSVTSIGGFAFGDCISLTSVTIPDSVTSIGDSAFEWCSSLTNITIPDSVTSIGDSAFRDCSALRIHGYKNSYAEVYAEKNQIPFEEIGQTLEITSFTADKLSPQVSGTKVKLTAEASGQGILQYKFTVIDNKTGTLYELRDYEESNTFIWETGDIGDKTLYVEVKDAGGKVIRKSMNYIVQKDSADKIKSNIKINNLQGSALEVILEAENEGEENLQYRFLFKDNEGNENIIKDFSNSNSVAWITPTIKNKEIYVEVKDEEGNVSLERIQETEE